MADERNRIEQAERLDAFWDELVRGNGQYAPTPSGSPDELESFALVERLQAIGPADDGVAQERLRRRVLGSGVLTANGSEPSIDRPVNPNGRVPASKAPVNRGRFSQVFSFAAMAAMLVVITGGFFLLNGNRGWFGSDESQEPVPAPLFAEVQATPDSEVSEQLATPALNPSQLSAGTRTGIIWSLAPPAADVATNHATLVDGTIYRLIESDEFTAIEAIDAESGSVKWSKPLRWTGSGIAGDDRAIYVPVEESGDVADSVVALDVESGDQLWSTNATWFAQTLTVADGVVYVWDGFRHMNALDAQSGEILWHAGDGDRIPAESRADVEIPNPIVAGEQIIVANASGQISGIVTSGAYTWSHDPFASGDVEIVLADDGTIIAAGLEAPAEGGQAVDNFATVLAIDPAHGSILWEKDIYSVAPSVQVVDSTVMVLADIPFRPPETETDDHRSNAPVHMYGLDLATGEVVYGAPGEDGTSNALVSDPGTLPYSSLAPFGPDEELLLALSEPGRITSLSTHDGSIRGIVDLGGTIAGPVLSDDEGVYVTVTDGTVLRIDPNVLIADFGLVANQETEKASVIDWTLQLPMKDGQFTQLGGMTSANGIIYRLIETANAKSVQAVYGPNGQLAWQVPVDWSDAGIAADVSGVYLVDGSNQLVALDPFSGGALWERPFGEYQVVSMALDNGEPILALETQQRSALFIWDESSTMTAVDATSGETLWATQTADATGPQSNDTGSPAPVVALDVVAMVDASGTVQAFDRDSGENLWSQPGFDGIDTRMAFQQGTLFVLSGDGQKSGGLQHLTAAGLDLESGDIKWEVEMVGPLYQPVATNETSFYVIANEVVTPSALEDTEQTLVDYDGPGAGSWTGSKVAMAEPDVGGTHVFGIDAETGSVIWSRSSLAGRFMQVWTGCPNSCGLRAATSDGYVVGLGRDSGSVSGDSTVLNGEPVEIISGGATALNGQFATLADGTLVAFGHVPYREQR